MATREDLIDALVADLPRFLDELQRNGFKLGLDQYVAAEDLLLALATRGALPEDPARLGTLLGPIVCSSPRDQEEFHRRFSSWVIRVGLGRLPGQACGVGRDTSFPGDIRGRKPTATESEGPDRTAPRGLTSGDIRGQKPTSSDPEVADRADRVARGGVHAAGKPDAPLAAELRKIERGRRIWARFALGMLMLVVVAGLIYAVYELRPAPLAPAHESSPAEPAGPRPGHSTPVKIPLLTALVLLPVAAWLGWQFWLAYRARTYLARRKAEGRFETERLFVEHLPTDLFRSAVLAHSAQLLGRHRRSIVLRALDATATIAATVRRAGYFLPIEGSRRVIPEHLILVERTDNRDLQGRVFDTLVDRLAENDLVVARYHFDGDPRVCAPTAGSPDALTLHELAARHPDRRLLILSDGAGLISPLTGEPPAWLDQLSAWPERVLLTPKPPDQWSSREQALVRTGLIVLPATEGGLMALVDRLESPLAPASVPEQPSPPYPVRLDRRPRRWLDAYPPDPDEVETLLVELRRYLGDTGFYWLAACAVYPALEWELTVCLGQNLTVDGHLVLDERRLMSLARLPWFRYGAMPDWLRLRLIETLTGPREADVRTTLGEILLTALNGPIDHLTLEVAREHGDALGSLVRPILRRLARKSPDDPLVGNRVFLTFFSGRKPSALWFDFPGSLREVLRSYPAPPPQASVVPTSLLGGHRIGFGPRVRLSLMMFLQFFVWGIWLPSIALFIGRGGINLAGWHQGWIFTVYGFGAIIGPFLVGRLADRYFATERVMAACHLLGGVLLIAAAYTTTFWPLFALLLVYCSLYMPTLGLSSSITFRTLGEVNQEQFPGIRLWGNIGWFVAGLFFSAYLGSRGASWMQPLFAVSWIGPPAFKDCLRLAGAISLVYGVSCFALPHTPPIPAKETGPIDRRPAVLELMRNRSFAVLVIITGLLGIMLAFYFGCENYFLQAIGTNPDHVGGYMTIGQVAEMVMMALVPVAVARLGVKKTMLVGAGAWALRFGLSMLGTPWWLMIASIALHGFCFGFFFVVAQMYVDRAASGDIKASAQNLLVFVVYGLGTILGSILTGVVRGHFQEDWTAIWAGPFVLTLLCIAAFTLLFREEEIRKPAERADTALV